MRKVYIEPLWKLHSFYKELISYSPEGYEFVTNQTFTDKAVSLASKISLFYGIESSLKKLIPLNIIRAYSQKYRKPPDGTDLTFATTHLVFRTEPWITDVEDALLFMGENPRFLTLFKRVAEKLFSSEHCRKIICWNNVQKESILTNFNCTKFRGKIETVFPAVRKKNFVKHYDDSRIKLLFVNSVNIPRQFRLKGGVETLEAFVQLSTRYKNLELVVRSDVPRDLRAKYERIKGLKIIDKPIEWRLIEREFKTADILILPTYVTPFMVFLDAMSYELPIVTRDAHATPCANAEIVEDGKTGFLVRGSYYSRGVDREAVSELVEKVSVLIEDPKLRRQMGKEGRRHIEEGKFSIENRNRVLRRIFDQAIG